MEQARDQMRSVKKNGSWNLINPDEEIDYEIRVQ